MKRLSSVEKSFPSDWKENARSSTLSNVGKK